jgi:hypothetical protein
LPLFTQYPLQPVLCFLLCLKISSNMFTAKWSGIVLCTVVLQLTGWAQSVGIGTNSPQTSALLEIRSTNKGLLIPRTSSSSRLAIANPAKGLLVYDTTVNNFWYYNGTAWGQLAGGGSGNNQWALNGTDLYNSNAGNIGIGTTTPLGKLEIRASNSFASPTLTLYENNGIEYARIQMQNASGANFWQLGALNNNAELFNERFLIFNSRLGNIVSITGDGSVGLGPNNLFPGGTLDVARGTAPWGTAVFRGSSTFSYFNFGTDEHTYIRAGKTTSKVYVNDNHNGSVILALGGGAVAIGREIPIASLDVAASPLGNSTAVFRGTENASIFNAISSGDTYIRGGKASSRVIIADLGASVGIGTDNPDAAYKLSVNGNIRTKEVVVQSGWADYVFAKNYPLMPLPQLEQYISAHQHLVNIPSAEEIVQNGLPLGDLQKRMMEKIEELTLYVISLNKKIAELEKKIN